MKLNKAFFVVPLLLCAAVQAAPPAGSFAALPLLEQEKQAATVLGATKAQDGDVFALGGVGFAGTRPDKYLAYQAVLRRKDAPAVFQKLLTSPSAVTQLYALAGLAKSAPSTFRTIAPQYQKRRDTVKMMNGCIAFERPLGDSVRSLLAGESPATYHSTPKPGRP